MRFAMCIWALLVQASVESQLAERQAQKKMERQLKLQEEQGSLSDMAAELKHKMDVRHYCRPSSTICDYLTST